MFEEVGGHMLAELTRHRMHDSVSALRDRLAHAMEASARAAAASNEVMRGTPRSWRMKAEELNTVADQTTNAKARAALRYLARSYDLLADRIEAGETARSERASRDHEKPADR